MSVYKVKPFTFDLVLSLAIAAYLAVLYLAVNVSSALCAVYLRAVFLRCAYVYRPSRTMYLNRLQESRRPLEKRALAINKTHRETPILTDALNAQKSA